MRENTLESSGSERGSLFYILIVSLVAALGGLLFGYDTAVISGAIGFMQERFSMSPEMKGWAASSALVGCIIGAAMAGTLSDKFGRKRVLILAAVLYFLSAVGSAIPQNLTQFVLARILGGIGVGTASMLSPLYISEIAPAKIRGVLVSLNQLAIVGGMLVVYFVNKEIASGSENQWNVDLGWRYMFGSESIPAALFFVLLFFVPESPRWLMKQGSTEKALAILTKVGGSSHAEKEAKEIQIVLNQEEGTFGELFRPGIRIALLVGIGLAIFQQITGINIVLYYAPEIFKSAGIDTGKAISDTVIIGAVNVVFTLIAIGVVDLLGRKVLLILASIGMGISLVCMGLAYRLEDAGTMLLVFTLVYVAAFAVAMGPIPWVLIAEIFPTRTRGRAMSIAVVVLWSSCYLVSQTFPVLLDWLKGDTFFVYAAMCVGSVIFTWLLVPETKGKTLEEIEESWFAKSNS